MRKINSIQDKIRIREEIVSSIRQFLKTNSYHEADVPVLVPALIPENYVESFRTQIAGPASFSGLNPVKDAFLTTSPEAYLKRLLVEGSGNIFYLGKAFRNGEPFGPLHNHEFTILEWYHVGCDYKQLMREIEQMIYCVGKNIIKNIDLTPPWETITVKEAFDRFVPENPTLHSPIRGGEEGFAARFEKNYVQYIEPNLGTRGKPTFITDFPAWQSPLAKVRAQTLDVRVQKKENFPLGSNVLNLTPNTAERFELYINGIELVNGWTELTDSKQQTINFKQEQEMRKKNGKSPIPTDTGFLDALKKGMPTCAGAAMGVDRLIMALTGAKSLDEVILFPTHKLF